MPSTGTHRPAVATMYLGLTLSLATTILPFVTANVLSNHIRSGYPDYGPAELNSAVTAYQVILALIGGLGVLSWLFAIWAAKRKSWSHWLAAGLFGTGTIIALCLLLTKDTSGELGVAPLLGWLDMLPCLAGLVAVVLLWRKQPRRSYT